MDATRETSLLYYSSVRYILSSVGWVQPSVFVNVSKKRRGSSQLSQNDRLHMKSNPEVVSEVPHQNIYSYDTLLASSLTSCPTVVGIAKIST